MVADNPGTRAGQLMDTRSKSMKFQLNEAFEVLQQTPYTVEQMVGGLSAPWTASSGDPTNWGVYDIVGHLIHGDETDWIPRAEIIYAQGDNRTFEPFDRTAQFATADNPSLADLITKFERVRDASLETLDGWQLTSDDLALKGVHPEFGEVTLEQLLATWVVHDLNHIAQIAKKIAMRYEEEVGPWKQYLSILQ